jgi:recombination protein RecR
LAADDPIEHLTELLARLPGVGQRTAHRLAFHLLGTERGYAEALGDAIARFHERVRTCGRCGNVSASDPCGICTDPRRSADVLCVVAGVADLHAIERAAVHRGRYHVLPALLAPLEGVGPSDVPLEPLVDRVRAEGVREVILATPPTVEGEATALYVAQALRPLGARVTKIASGIQYGGDLEYADPVTLGRALDGRREV